MKNKLTLNQAWKVCLRMWKWIVEQRQKGRNDDVGDLKDEWFETQQKKYSRIDICAGCFFCEYDVQNNDICDECLRCPGRLVSKSFNCCHSAYDCYTEQAKFYKKLLQLDAKRRNNVIKK